MIKVKVTEMESGNSFVEKFNSMANARDYIEFVNAERAPSKFRFVLKAEIVK